MTLPPHEHAIGAEVWYWDRDQAWDAWRPAVVYELGYKDGYPIHDVLPTDGKKPSVGRWGWPWQIAARVEGQPMPPAPDLAKVQP